MSKSHVEKVEDAAPGEAAGTRVLPSRVEDLNPAWLTAELRAAGVIDAAAEITEARAERIALETGFSSELYRVHVSGAGHVPTSIIAKLPTTTVVRQGMDALGGYAREVAFYAKVAPRAPLKTPRAYVSRMAEDSTDFVLVLEDLQAWENGDHFAGLPLDRARAIIAELAGLHAWSAQGPNAATAAEFPSLDTPVTRQLFPIVFEEGWQMYKKHARVPISPGVEEYAERFSEHVVTALEALTERNMLVHGDIRADNVFFADGQVAVVDFQFAARGVGTLDIAYLVSQGLTPAERGSRDEQLLREYLIVLAAQGVNDYGFDEAWRHYRFGVAFFLLFPVSALRGWDQLPERSRELCLRLVERSLATIEDTDALAVFS